MAKAKSAIKAAASGASHFNPLQKRDATGKWTKDETRAWLGRHPIAPSNIVDMWNQATPGEKASGRTWYPNAHKIAVALAKRHGVSTRQAAGILATYSPQTPWGRNTVLAAEVLRHKKGIGGPGAKLHIDITPGGPLEEKPVGVMAPTMNKTRAERILAGEDFEHVFAGLPKKDGTLPPNGLKIRAFGNLIALGGQDPNAKVPAVVIDRHAAGVARGVRFTEEDYGIDGPSSSLKKFEAYANAYRDAATEISKIEGRPVAPEEIQATTWLTRQRLNTVQTEHVAAGGGSRRKSLGARDTAEQTGYFTTYAPDIADILKNSMTGYAELSRAQRLDIALSVRHVASEEGVRRYHLPIGTPLDGSHDAPDAMKPKWHLTPEEIQKQKSTEEKLAFDVVGQSDITYSMVVNGGPGEDQHWDDYDFSAHAQIAAQFKASREWGATSVDGEPVVDETAQFWVDYQCPNLYEGINSALRDPNAPAHQDTLDLATEMFQEMGYTTCLPITLFRGVNGTKARDFKVGDTYVDPGLVSSTAQKKFAEGWIAGPLAPKKVTPEKAFVLSIKVPPGARITGGALQFCETMLPPGVPLKITKVEKVVTHEAISPLRTTKTLPPLHYTAVEAEVDPAYDWSQWYGPNDKKGADQVAQYAAL